jgi:hypothetical protein
MLLYFNLSYYYFLLLLHSSVTLYLNLVDLDELDLELEGSVGGDDGRETSSTVGWE